MTIKDQGNILMLLACLQDVAEKSHDLFVQLHVEQIVEKIERIIKKDSEVKYISSDEPIRFKK